MRRALLPLLLLSAPACDALTDKGGGASDTGAGDSGGGTLGGGDGTDGTDGTDGGSGDCGGVVTVLWLGESGSEEDHPLVQAAAALGMVDVRIVEQEEELNAAMQPGDVNLLVIDAPADVPDEAAHAAILAHRDAGRPIIAGIYDLHRDPDIWGPMFGVSGVDEWDEHPIFPVAGASVDLFAGPSPFPAPLDIQSSGWSINHHALTLLGDGEVLAELYSAGSGTAAIVRTFGGQVLFNGTFATNYRYVDADEDGVNDGTELFINEMSLMAGCGG